MASPSMNATMKVRIPLFPLLEQLMESIGGPTPEIILKEKYASRATVVIAFGPNKVNPRVPDLSQTFYGEDPHSTLLAEHKSIMAVTDHLASTFGLEIHDISKSKIMSSHDRFAGILSTVQNSSQRLHGFLRKYESSTKPFDAFLVDSSSDSGTPICPVASSLNEIIASAISEIRGYQRKLVGLDREKTALCIEGTSSTSTCTFDLSKSLQSPRPVYNVCEKHVLSDFLKYLGISPAKYSNSLTENEFFRGKCKIYIGSNEGSETTGGTNIWGEEKSNPYDVECSAAAKAVRFLERTRSMEIVDFNYDLLNMERQKLNKIMHLRSKYDALVCQANGSWSSFIDDIQELIDKQYGLSQPTAVSTYDACGYFARIGTAAELDEALSQIKERNHNAISDMASLIN